MRIFFSSLLLCIGILGFSQNKQLLYGVSEVPQALLQNPGGIVPFEKHFGIPLFSHFHINGGSSGVNVYDIFQTSNTTDINMRITNRIRNMSNSDFFTVTQQLEFLNFGWRSNKDIYFSGGVYQEFDMITYFPRDLALLAWEGNADYINYEFDLGEINTSGDLLTVYHFGANKQITDKLTLGARLKVYSSIFNYNSTSNKGTFVTRESLNGDNIYDHLLEGADIQVQTSGIASLVGNDNVNGAGDVIKHVMGRALLGGNLGVGMDIGGTYEINSNWTASASVLDLGAVFHTNDVENYRVTGDYNLSGINLQFPPLQNNEPTNPYYQNLLDELEEEVAVDTLSNKYTLMRPLKMNASLVYNMRGGIGGNPCDCLNMADSEREQNIGLQLYSIFRPKKPQFAATLFYYRRFSQFLSGKITYTVDSFSKDNVGLMAVGDFGKVNFYLGMDNLLRLENIAKANHVSLQLGVNIKYQ